jgi:predicted nucleotidyltransferase
MAGFEDNLKRLEVIAEGLGHLTWDSIFIGGACTQFYVEDPSLHDFRPTNDIDCIVKVYSYKEFDVCSEELRKLGFAHDTSEGAPIVRWIYKGILVDILPDKCSVVGYRNIEWFREGREHAEERRLPSGKVIRILPLAYYMATKLDSWEDRGGGDFLASKDLEDIVGIIDGRDNLEELLQAPENVRNFVIERFAYLIRNENFKRSIAGHLGFDSTAAERARNVVQRIAHIIDRFRRG